MEDLEKFTPPPPANASGGTITTGVNVADLSAADDAYGSQSGEDGGSSGSGGGGDAVHPMPILSPAFHVYWDDTSRSYKVNNPKVIDPSGNEVSVGGPQSFGDGDIFCEIKFNKSGGTYFAKLTTSRSQADDVIATVPIATIAAAGVTQYHVGVIVITGTYITGEAGSVSGGNAVTVHGNVKAQGDSGSGLKVRTWELGSQKFLSIDLSGRTAQQSFGIHDVKDSSGTATGTKIFSTDDVQAGGGGSDEATVLTGFGLSLNGNELLVTWHKVKIKGVTTETVADDNPERLMLLENIDVVNSVSYTNPNCTQSRMTIVAFTGQAIENDPNANVFTTTPHSAEHGGS